MVIVFSWGKWKLSTASSVSSTQSSGVSCLVHLASDFPTDFTICNFYACVVNYVSLSCLTITHWPSPKVSLVLQRFTLTVHNWLFTIDSLPLFTDTLAHATNWRYNYDKQDVFLICREVRILKSLKRYLVGECGLVYVWNATCVLVLNYLTPNYSNILFACHALKHTSNCIIQAFRYIKRVGRLLRDGFDPFNLLPQVKYIKMRVTTVSRRIKINKLFHLYNLCNTCIQ